MPDEESTILKMFNAGDGLYFGRRINGDVHIIKINEQTSEPEADIVVDADTWVSALTSVAYISDTAATHTQAKELHFGKDD